MHPENIKAEIRKKLGTLKVLADELGVDSSTITQVIRSRRSRRVEEAIAKHLGKPVARVFPNRYSEKAA